MFLESLPGPWMPWLLGLGILLAGAWYLSRRATRNTEQRKRSSLLSLGMVMLVSIAGFVGGVMFRTETMLSPPVSVNHNASEIVVTGSRIPWEKQGAGPGWNVWFEDGHLEQPRFKPVPVLKPESGYSLRTHLSALFFAKQGVTGQGLRPDLLQALLDASDSPVELTLMLIYDERFFRLARGAKRVASLKMDPQKLRDYKLGQLLSRQSQGDPLLDFGATAFQLETTDKVGPSALAVSVWVNGSPVQEIGAVACVSSGSDQVCEEEARSAVSLYGTDAIRVAPQLAQRSLPSAALHFVSFGDDPVVGVFRCNVCGWSDHRFLTWTLRKNETDLIDSLAQTLQPALQRAQDNRRREGDVSLQGAGADLYRAFFHSDDRDAKLARTEFEAFLAARSQAGDRLPRSIFVRFISGHEDPPLYGVPLGLMYAPVSGTERDFIGAHYRIDQPLEYQDYNAVSTCIEDWIVLAPPPAADGELDQALESLGDWLAGVQASKRAVVYNDLRLFRDWLESDPDDDVVGKEGSAILILGHHENNTLYFDGGLKDPSLTPYAIDRQFASPTLAIINACGSAAPGAVDFVTGFNRSGAASVLATSTTVNARMAGRFMATLAGKLRSLPGDEPPPIGDAVFETQQELKPIYGPQVFTYGLYGNSSLRVCAPEAVSHNPGDVRTDDLPVVASDP